MILGVPILKHFRVCRAKKKKSQEMARSPTEKDSFEKTYVRINCYANSAFDLDLKSAAASRGGMVGGGTRYQKW